MARSTIGGSMLRRAALLLGVPAVVAMTLNAPVSRAADQPDEAKHPNIVFIMADDLSTDIVPYMSTVAELAAEGVSFSNYIVSNSLCCPSRAGFLTGKYPHNNHVETNDWPDGGVSQFFLNDEQESVGVYLQEAGYRTGLVGKLLNHYTSYGAFDGDGGQPDYPRAHVPAGWDEAWLLSDGYGHFEYQVTKQTTGQARVVEVTGEEERRYLTDAMARQADKFIERNAEDPFFLTLAPLAVHFGLGDDPERRATNRFPAAPRDRSDSRHRPREWEDPEFPARGDCGGPNKFGGCSRVAYPPTPQTFNKLVVDAADWAPDQVLDKSQLKKVKHWYFQRIRMAQALDDLVLRVRKALEEADLENETYLVFGSDNGYYLGDHALFDGKTTPYDHDVRLPFIVVPPGGTEPRTETELVSNVDLLPTFADIAGLTKFDEPVDGASFQHVIDGTSGPTWRQAALIQHLRARDDEGVRETTDLGKSPVRVPTFRALRTETYLYADYGELDGVPPADHRTAEYFDLVRDPYQTKNIYDTLSQRRKQALNDAAAAYRACSGSSCWSAGLVAP